jgi:hypothetical protein
MRVVALLSFLSALSLSNAITLEENYAFMTEMFDYSANYLQYWDDRTAIMYGQSEYIYEKVKKYEFFDRVNRLDDAVQDVYDNLLGPGLYKDLTGTSITSNTFSDAQNTDSDSSVTSVSHDSTRYSRYYNKNPTSSTTRDDDDDGALVHHDSDSNDDDDGQFKGVRASWIGNKKHHK